MEHINLNTKLCCTCKQIKSVSLFYKASQNMDGLQRQCKECKKSSSRATNKERCIRYRLKHPVETKQQSKAWRESNSKYSIDYYHKNKAKWLERTARYSKKKYHNDPVYRLKRILSTQIWCFLSEREKTNNTRLILGYTPQELIDKIGVKQVNFELDHKIPISWFSENTPVCVIWHMDNLQWIASAENREKSNKRASPVAEQYLKIALPHIKEEFLSKFACFA